VNGGLEISEERTRERRRLARAVCKPLSRVGNVKGVRSLGDRSIFEKHLRDAGQKVWTTTSDTEKPISKHKGGDTWHVGGYQERR